MVGSTLALRSKMVTPSTIQLSSLSRRSLTTRAPVQALRSSQTLTQQVAQRATRRPYSDAAPASSPAPKPRKRFSFLRWTWRLTLLAGLGLAGNLVYNIYDQRNPIEQAIPDPKKKTLVVLGTLHTVAQFRVKLPGIVLIIVSNQDPDGALFLSSRSSTPKTTMSSLSRPAITSSSLPCCRHAPLARLSTARSWSRFEAFSVTSQHT